MPEEEEKSRDVYQVKRIILKKPTQTHKPADEKKICVKTKQRREKKTNKHFNKQIDIWEYGYNILTIDVMGALFSWIFLKIEKNANIVQDAGKIGLVERWHGWISLKSRSIFLQFERWMLIDKVKIMHNSIQYERYHAEQTLIIIRWQFIMIVPVHRVPVANDN